MGDISKTNEIIRFITSINEPKFVVTPETPAQKPFEYIRITMNVTPEWYQDRKRYIETHLNEFDTLIFQTIEMSTEFQSYKVPITELKIVKRLFSMCSNYVEFMLKLKSSLY